MNRGQIRERVRYRLGELKEGYWREDVLNGLIQQAADRHAREGLSVERSRKANTINNIQEYDFPSSYGELIAVRYNDESYGYEGDELVLVNKSAILDSGYNYNFLGYPQYYYVFDDGFGLFPVPNKPPVFSYMWAEDERCPHFTAPQDLETNTIYRTCIGLDYEPPTEAGETEDEDCYVLISHIALYLRRQGPTHVGDLQLAFSQLDGGLNTIFRVDSVPIPAESIGPRPRWYTFDFSDEPLEITPDATNYELWLYSDSDYASTVRSAPGNRGIYVGSQQEYVSADGFKGTEGEIHDAAFFQLHRLRNDLEIDFFVHETKPMLTDDDEPEQHPRFHEDIVEIALAMAWDVGNRNRGQADKHERKAIDQINQSRTRQLMKSHGQKVRTERITLANVPYANYDKASDTFTVSVLGYG